MGPIVIVTVTLNPSLDRTLAVPRLAWNEVLRATASRLDWGGKGFNVSRALQALGAESLAMGLVGGATGERLQRGLHELGIATDLVPITGETRSNTVIAEEAGERYVKVNEPGPPVQAEELAAFLDRARARLRPGDLWVLAGNLPPGAPSDFYAQIIALIREGGGRVLLDTGGEPLRLGCAAGPYLIKPNQAEFEELTGQAIRSQTGALRAARACLGQGVALVALSLAAEGLLLAAEGQAVHAVPPVCGCASPSAPATHCWRPWPGHWSEGSPWQTWPVGGSPPGRPPPCARASAWARRRRCRPSMSGCRRRHWNETFPQALERAKGATRRTRRGTRLRVPL
jgi:1-phosphofructokinase family hexose kinase